MGIFVQLKNLIVFIFIKNFFKLLMILILSIFLFIILFPKSEFSDFVSKTVAEQTNYQIKFDFENLSFSLSNTLGVQLDRVFFEMNGRPAITLKELIASPDIMAAINSKPYGRIKMSGLFSGEAEITISKHKMDAETVDKKGEHSQIAIKASQIDLMGLKTFLKLPFEMRGRAEISSKAISIFHLQPPTADGANSQVFQLVEVPELTLTVKNFDMPAFTLEQGLPLPLNVPGIKLSEIVLKGRLSENMFQIQELQLGRPSDELTGTIKGNVSLMKGPVPFPEKYELVTDLKMRQSFHDKISLLLPILNADKFVKPFIGGYSFKTKISWSMGPDLPAFGPAQ